MKIGDLVKFKGEDEKDPATAKGILIEIRNTVGGTHGVMWDFLVSTGYGMIGWQREREIEVISENR